MTLRERLEWLVANPDVQEIIVNVGEARELLLAEEDDSEMSET